MLVAAMAVFLVTAAPLHGQTFRPNVLDPSYDHDRWGTSINGIVKDFRAYRSSFDDLDNDDGFGGPDALASVARSSGVLKPNTGLEGRAALRVEPVFSDE